MNIYDINELNIRKIKELRCENKELKNELFEINSLMYYFNKPGNLYLIQRIVSKYK